MIVATPTWTHREKRTRRDREWLGSRWTRSWHDTDNDYHAAHCRVHSNGFGFHAIVYLYSIATPRRTVQRTPTRTLEEAQAVCDKIASGHLLTDVDTAVANWKAWRRSRRASRPNALTYEQVKGIRGESGLVRSLKDLSPDETWGRVVCTPETEERCRRMIEELDEAGGRR